MTRSLKALGLALVAVLALSAVAASGASAKPKLTPVPEEYPVTLKGSQSTKHVFLLPGNRRFECTNVTFEGSIANKAEAETSELTVTPSYTGCTAEILGNITPVTVTMNGCKYKLTAEAAASGKAAEEGYEYTGNVFVTGCNAGKTIEVHVWQTEAKHLANEASLCTYTIAEQGPLQSSNYKLENGGTEGTIQAAVSKIKVKKASGTVTNCGEAEQEATYNGNTHVEGFNSKGEMLKGTFDPS